jgi:hypothetical protein
LEIRPGSKNRADAVKSRYACIKGVRVGQEAGRSYRLSNILKETAIRASGIEITPGC